MIVYATEVRDRNIHHFNLTRDWSVFLTPWNREYADFKYDTYAKELFGELRFSIHLALLSWGK